MKKFICCLCLCLSFISNANASEMSINQLNSDIKKLLLPLQNPATVAQLKFNTIEFNEEQQPQRVDLSGLYRKVGSKNFVNLKIDNFSYDSSDASTPTLAFKGSLGVDLTRFRSVNTLIPETMAWIDRNMDKYRKLYGDAISIKHVITSATKDAQGNYTSITTLFAAKIELDRLTGYPTPDQVDATSLVFSLTMNLKKGVELNAYLTLHPGSDAAMKLQYGLEYALQHLFTWDDEAKEMINHGFNLLEEFAPIIVESISNTRIITNLFKK